MVRVDTSNFNGFCRQIAAKPLGLKAWDVMLYEVGKVLEGCVRLTTREQVDKITRSIEFKNRTLRFGGKGSGPATIYITKKGVVWFAEDSNWDGHKTKDYSGPRLVSGKSFHAMNDIFHWGQPRWDRYQQFLAQLRNQQIVVRDVIGRAGQSWVQIAESLGLQINAPGYVRNAPGFRGTKHVNGVSKKAVSGDKLFIEMKNLAPILLGTMDGNRILQTSINGRYKHFQNSLRKGAFEDVALVARQYPGLLARAA